MFGIIFSFVASQILYFALHLESSSFPKPLSARDEIAAFEAMKNGDMAARCRNYGYDRLAYAIRNSNQRSIIGKGHGNNHSVYTTVNTRA